MKDGESEREKSVCVGGDWFVLQSGRYLGSQSVFPSGVCCRRNRKKGEERKGGIRKEGKERGGQEQEGGVGLGTREEERIVKQRRKEDGFFSVQKLKNE